MKYVITFLVLATALFGQAVVPFPQGSYTTWQFTDLGSWMGVTIQAEDGYFISYTRFFEGNQGYTSTYVIGATKMGTAGDVFSPSDEYVLREVVGAIKHQIYNPVTGESSFPVVRYYSKD